MAPPVTDFAVKEKYMYLEGLGNYHSSEAFPGANPLVNNTPQKPPYGLRTERISGTSFTAPRHRNLQTWLYRTASSLDHDGFTPYTSQPSPSRPTFISPDSYMWPALPDLDPATDWLSQRLLAGNGDPLNKTGVAIWVFAINQSMPPNTAFSSLDGELLIIPQSGSLDIQTELGKLLVRQNEICVIPRGIRHRVSLVPDSPTCRGYICELYQGHFQLPDLGAIGSTGLANVRDFQIPTAHYDGQLIDSIPTPTPLDPKDADKNYTIISRQAMRLWATTQSHTAFDVAAWHGTCYPYKFDLGRFCVMGNALFDEHDPSLYAVLSAPANRDTGSAAVEFLVIPPRWQVAEDTFWLPYFHRNTMNEFYGPIITAQDREHGLNGGQHDTARQFRPFMAGLNGSMVTHGATEPDFKHASERSLTPEKLMADGLSVFVLETELPLLLSEWAAKAAIMNGGRKKAEAKI
ncbi:homogentisate 1,2-dioxygenase [Exophiala mesophila]|uniref:homogentisate 1,2-dioxygenase n=1 Tax=Exophiala mesophila TaxID=212818 RepID=A0A0D1X2A7_EXOME|nr:homogentisate 1,2-dioxygenase [Exophiala mesophila]KIV95900.1 homogentisate 1,2-dioxygenase [Exophiala mesophila]